MSKGLEPIYFKKNLLAIVFRNNLKVSGVKFFTEEINPFQIGLHGRKKGVKIVPHIHNLNSPIQVTEIQEMLFIQDGKIRVTLYTPKKEVISRKILSKGDAILLMSGAHSVDFLEDSRIFEIKQGPYPGATHAKIYLK